MARAYGVRSQMALAFESVYGTAPASGYFTMPFVSTTLSAKQPLIDNDVIGLGRDPQAPGRDAITVGGDVVVPIDGIAMGHWLKALFGAPTTTGAGPYTHTFHSGATSLPSLAIEVGAPEVPSFAMYEGVRADVLDIAMQRSGNLQARIGLIGREESLATSTGAGSPAAIALTRFNHFQGSIKRDGTPLGNIVSSQITYSNGLEPVEVIAADGLVAGVDPVMASLRGNIVARFDTTTLLTQAVNGSACELEFAWAIGGGASLTLTAHAVFLPRPERQIPGPGGIQVTFDWIAAKDTSPARMATVVLINSQASYA